MRRTVRLLSALALGGVILGFCASAAWSEPVAEVSPSTAQPGGSVTVSVRCDPIGGPAPATLDATSMAFEEGTVTLHKVGEGDTLHKAGESDALYKAGEDDGKGGGPAYRGTARISSAAELEGEGDSLGPDTAWTVDGTCPAAPGGQGKQWSATFTVAKGGHTSHPPRPCATEPHRESCPPAVIQRGVHAGQGGAFTDSVPALIAGGTLIAAAAGGAGYRLWRRKPAEHI
ncbi:hypothetical protein Stsp02_52010 [Streptomyces sp. NBRC 14336]|uniref:hypothetical protein n=1 Tax=Streptomyces sp. NBRC 14336 TaxID=3030992 RepID=UPI0024A03F28|nr:hypothetical protein [Streptomyces sp. NBRC 14336]WBO81361.1 hypothetical protein SBE_005203 [Streptomyces sp. SBE_14.2]GLW49540.1 hypothetical protein Stsp02_52010 [Streptomyces sp. NBRC 14336]